MIDGKKLETESSLKEISSSGSDSVAILLTIIGIIVIVLVGWLVLNRMVNDFNLAEEFCLDKEGMWNLSDERFLDFRELNNYGLLTEALS